MYFATKVKLQKWAKQKKLLADARFMVYNIQIFSFWGHSYYLQKKV